MRSDIKNKADSSDTETVKHETDSSRGKTIYLVLSALFTFISAVSAATSCQKAATSNTIATNSNSIASKALKETRKINNLQVRPWLNFEISKKDEKYITYEYDQDTKSYSEKFYIKIKNIGNSPAIDIKIPSTVHSISNKNTSHILILDKKYTSISLGAGETLEAMMFSNIETYPPNPDLLNVLESDETKMSIKIPIKYYGLINKNTEYSTTIHYSISTNIIEIIKHDYL